MKRSTKTGEIVGSASETELRGRDNESRVGVPERAEVRRNGWRGVRASEPGRGAVRQSGKPPGKQGRQTG